MMPCWNHELLCKLKRHASTLRTIELRCRTNGICNDPIFDASLSPKLTNLSLSFCKSINVLGPNVTHFTWHISKQYTYSNATNVIADADPYSYFDERKSAFLRDIATAAVNQNAPLRMIHVEFNPVDDGRDAPNPWNHYNTLSAWYPWDLMERVRGEVMIPSGRELTYSKPPFESKEAWQSDFSAAVKQRENSLKREIADAQARERDLRGFRSR